MGEATLRQRRNGGLLGVGQRTRGRSRQRRMIETKRVTDEDAGIELGRIEAGGAKFFRQRPAGTADGRSLRAVVS